MRNIFIKNVWKWLKKAGKACMPQSTSKHAEINRNHIYFLHLIRLVSGLQLEIIMPACNSKVTVELLVNELSYNVFICLDKYLPNSNKLPYLTFAG